MSATASLLEVFSRLDDPRKARGVRHPFAGIVALTVLGMLARIREMEVLVRWATVHWDSLREPLGFNRDEPPCATTISRTLAKCSVEDFQSALNQWLRHHVAQGEGVLAVDGKTAKQGIDSDGKPPAHAQRVCARCPSSRRAMVNRRRQNERAFAISAQAQQPAGFLSNA